MLHVAEGTLPIPADKTRFPLTAFLRLLEEAQRPPAELKVFLAERIARECQQRRSSA